MKGRFRQIEKDIAELKALKTDIQELKWLIEDKNFWNRLKFWRKKEESTTGSAQDGNKKK